MKLGIVGHGADKFTDATRRIALSVIEKLAVENHASQVISGHSPVGGVDIFAEQVAKKLSIPTKIFAPTVNCWDDGRDCYGFRSRNLDIASFSDKVIVILVAEYPPNYSQRKFPSCYHCDKHNPKPPKHAKSGGCFTAWQAHTLNKPTEWVIIYPNTNVAHFSPPRIIPLQA